MSEFGSDLAMKNTLSGKKIRNKIVVFGAGKIGRSFIGQLFSSGGYKVIFIDKNEQLIEELNKRNSYNIIIKKDPEEIINVRNVSGLKLQQKDEIINEIVSTEIMAVSSGPAGLTSAICLIAEGLKKRSESSSCKPLDIIIAENLRNASGYFETELKKLLPENFPLKTTAGLIETSIGKMVPIMSRKDIEEDSLQIFAEAYNTLILDRQGFLNPVPDIKGLSPKNNIKAWVDCKLFIHNLGHAASAYLGYLYDPHMIFIYEALEIPEIYKMVRSIMLQSSLFLLKKYPEDFTESFLTVHIDDLLQRFCNRSLGDTIFRVGCDLYRKLGPEDRIAGCIKLAIEQDLPYDKVLPVLLCACRFNARDEEGNSLESDLDFIKKYKDDIAKVLEEVCGFDPVNDKEIFLEALSVKLM